MIDWNRVDELRSEVGDEDFREIAALFLAEIGEAVSRLPAITAAEMADALHGLRGSAMNLGFGGLASLCTAGEAAPEAAPVSEIALTWAEASAAFRTRFPALA